VPMPFIHSAQQDEKSIEDRVYHDNKDCWLAKRIRNANRRYGAEGYRHCEICHALNLRDETRSRSKSKR
jgi:hypothetical protein